MTETTNDFYSTARLAADTTTLPHGSFVGVKHIGNGWFDVYADIACESAYVGRMHESALREFAL